MPVVFLLMFIMGKRLFGLTLCIALCLLHERAAAGPIPEAARALYREATADYNIGHFEEALTKFERVAKLHHHPNVVLAIAQCHRQLGNLKRALFGYRLYRSMSPSSTFADIDQIISRLENAITDRRSSSGASREPDTPRAVLQLQGIPEAATVLLDDTPVAATSGVPLRLLPGAHRLEVMAAGFRKWTRRLTVEPGQTLRLTVDSEPLERQRSRAWLAAALATTGAAVTAEALALVMTVKANDEVWTTDAFDRYRSAAIAGHVVAGLAAVGAVLSWVFYARSGKPAAEATAAGETRLTVLPSCSGGSVGAVLSF
jgi:tetratricopeptide (TPR) repeat protein